MKALSHMYRAEPAKTNFTYFPQERKRGVCGVFPWLKVGLAGRLHAPFVPEPTNAAFVAFFLDFLAFLASLEPEIGRFPG